MSSPPALAPDAAIVLGIASTAMPFARTPHEEVERWLRVLRMHGQVGIALQALGVSEQPLADEHEHASTSSSAAQDVAQEGVGAHASGPHERDAVALVSERAVQIARERHAQSLATTDLLKAVIDVYGEDFDSVLRVHGADRDELLQRLA